MLEGHSPSEGILTHVPPGMYKALVELEGWPAKNLRKLKAQL